MSSTAFDASMDDCGIDLSSYGVQHNFHDIFWTFLGTGKPGTLHPMLLSTRT